SYECESCFFLPDYVSGGGSPLVICGNGKIAGLTPRFLTELSVAAFSDKPDAARFPPNGDVRPPVAVVIVVHGHIAGLLPGDRLRLSGRAVRDYPFVGAADRVVGASVAVIIGRNRFAAGLGKKLCPQKMTGTVDRIKSLHRT